nr:uncharacterized protein LOC112426045 [Macaca nemestrina]
MGRPVAIPMQRTPPASLRSIQLTFYGSEKSSVNISTIRFPRKRLLETTKCEYEPRANASRCAFARSQRQRAPPLRSSGLYVAIANISQQMAVLEKQRLSLRRSPVDPHSDSRLTRDSRS